MQTATVSVGFQGVSAQPLRILRAHRYLICYILIYYLIGVVVARQIDLPDKLSLTIYATFILYSVAFYIGGFLLVYPVYVMIFVRPARLTHTLLTRLRYQYLTAERLLGAGIVVLMIPLFISIFTSFKTLIPFINPYAWDVALADWDRLLHFGVDPWRLLHPLIAFPWVSSTINIGYHVWFFMLYGMLFWQAFSTRDQQLRLQYLLTFVLTYSLLGGLAATLLSSAGPVYYGRVTGLEDSFAPLMDYLRAANEVAPIWALKVQDMLWQSHIMGEYDFGTGISAMPSMHVSSTLLFALVGWRTHRWFGIALTLFTLLVLVGSVHLGWHYAIDGYVALVATWILWRFAGWLAKRSLRPDLL